MQEYNAFLNTLGVPEKLKVFVYSTAFIILSQNNDAGFLSLTTCLFWLLRYHTRSSKPMNFFRWQIFFTSELTFSKQIPEQYLHWIIPIQTQVGTPFQSAREDVKPLHDNGSDQIFSHIKQNQWWQAEHWHLYAKVIKKKKKQHLKTMALTKNNLLLRIVAKLLWSWIATKHLKTFTQSFLHA